MTNDLAEGSGSPPGPPPLNGWTVAAALGWAAPLLYLDWTHVQWNGDVDVTAFVVAVVALAPAWVFMGRNVAIEAFGQKISVTTTQADDAFRKAIGAGPGPDASAAGADPKAVATSEAPAAAALSEAADRLSDSADDISSGAPSELRERVAPALVQAVSMLKLAAASPAPAQTPAQPRTVVLAGPAPPGNPLIDLRNRINSRLRALATAQGIDVSRMFGTSSLLNALASAKVITPEERTGLMFYVNIGNQAAHGAKVPSDVQQQVADQEPSLIDSLDRKIAGSVDRA